VAIATPQALRLGTEWNSGNIQSALSILGVFGIILLLTAIARISAKNFVRSTPALSKVEGMYARPERSRRDVRSVIILIPLSLLLFLASLKSIRFAEYFQPLLALVTALLASTINWKQFFKSLHLPLPKFSITSSSKLKFLYDVRCTPVSRVVEEMYENRNTKFEIRNSKYALLLPLLLLLSLALSLVQHALSAYTSTHHAKRFLADQYQIPMQAISAIANPGDRVYHSMWDEFPILFFHDQNLRYVSGMDPTFLYKSDPALAMAYQDLVYNTSTTADSAYNLIHNRLQARFIIIDHERWPALAALISTDPRYTFLAEGNGATSYIMSNP
jgi:asparagine N-glycosylation enzyme membrane subunit Stt3